MTNFILLLIFGYLLGSIPFGYLVSKAKGINIQKVGSGATGGTNVSRALGLKWGIIVAVLDILKAVIPTYLAVNYLYFDWQIVLVALMPALGHVFPVWLKFKGGKAISTALGSLIVLISWQNILILVAIWLFILISFRVMSLASLSAASFAPLMIWLSSFSFAYLFLGYVFVVLVFWAHRGNIKRMIEGTEKKFTFKKSINLENNKI